VAGLRGYGRVACAAAAAGAVTWISGGCGTRPEPAGHPGTASQVRPPRGGSPALARTVGRRMLAALPFPAGTRRTGPRKVPRRQQVTATPNLVDLSRFYVVPLRPAAAWAFFASHPPPGERKSAWAGPPRGGPEATFVADTLTAPPAGIDQESDLVVSMASGPHGRTLVRADAEVVWYPPRTAAEYIWPARYRAAAVSAWFTQAAGRGARTFTSRAIIARIARLFDGMRTVTPGPVYGCPPQPAGGFTIALRLARPGQPVLKITPGFCLGDMVSAGSRPQPMLQDFDSLKALALLRALLRPAAVRAGHRQRQERT